VQEEEVRQMPKVAKDYTAKKKDEILDACEKLYAESSFREVTIKDIAADPHCGCSRPSIYNYFDTIEEIFLGLLGREYIRWTEDLQKILAKESLTRDELARDLAVSLSHRKTMLRIQATNLYEIEENSRLERLVAFKKQMMAAMDILDEILRKFVPDMSGEEREQFRTSFIALLYGIYPCTEPTEKQCEAMDAVGMPHPDMTIEAFTYGCIRRLLS
jgi:AcrR family transcriptional regulator